MHPPWDRRRLLAAGALTAVAPWAWPQPAAAPERVAGAWPEAGPLRLSFDVLGEPENRLVFSTLRSTVRIGSVTLLDPAQRVAWRASGAALAWRDRRTMQRPELGEGYSLPPHRDAAAGRWTLLLERPGPQRGGGSAEVAVSVLPRFQLDIVVDTPDAAAGQPVLVSLRPQDYGVPVAGLPGIELRVLDARGTRTLATQAVEGLRSREGIALSEEKGVYRARLTLAQPGRYTLEAAQAFTGRHGAVTRTAQRGLQVAGRRGSLALAALRTTPGAGGCVKALLLDFDIDAQAAGTYACNLTLRGGDPTLPRAAASAELAAGPGRLTVSVDAAKLSALGPGWQRVDRAVLLHLAGNEFRVVAELLDVDLAPFGVAFQPQCT